MSESERQGKQVELESRIAYQEDTLLKLDAVVAEQGRRIARLEERLARLAERLEAARGPAG